MGEHDYTDIATLRRQMGINDPGDDILLASAITAVSRAIDLHTGTHFYPIVETREFEVSDSGSVWVDRFTDPTDLAVATGTDGTYPTSVDAAAYVARGTRIGPDLVLDRLDSPGRAWPAGYGRPTVAVTAAWGWHYVPEPVEMAARIKAARLFRRKDSPEGVLGNADFGVIRVSREDPDVWSLLAPFTDPGVY